MKLPLTIVIFLYFGISVWAQRKVPTIFFEKRHGTVMRIEKHRTVEVVSEKSFTIPIYTFNEVALFRLDHRMTTYNKNVMIKLVSNFIKRKRRKFDFDKLEYIIVYCYFNKTTYELTDISYVVDSGLISKYSTLKDLTDELKNEGNLSINKNINERFLPIASSDQYAVKYFRLSFSISDSDLKPYLNELRVRNKSMSGGGE